MEPRIQNGFLRAIIFMPLWMITMGFVVTIGSILVMLLSGVDMANPESAEALFANMSFDSPSHAFNDSFSGCRKFFSALDSNQIY